jgi:hypothetical protein
MTEIKEQAPEYEGVRQAPAFGGIAIVVFVLSELLCVALLALVFL